LTWPGHRRGSERRRSVLAGGGVVDRGPARPCRMPGCRPARGWASTACRSPGAVSPGASWPARPMVGCPPGWGEGAVFPWCIPFFLVHSLCGRGAGETSYPARGVHGR
jgi:hypothetical protein